MKKNAVFQKVPDLCSALLNAPKEIKEKKRIENIVVTIDSPKGNQHKEMGASMKFPSVVANSTTNLNKGGPKGGIISVPRGVVPLTKKAPVQNLQGPGGAKCPVVSISIQKPQAAPLKIAVQPPKKGETPETLIKRCTTPTKH
jgi:hypothetical protein